MVTTDEYHPPKIKSGRFETGSRVRIGQNVVIDVDEEMVVGERCVLPDNAYFCGRRITIGNDFYGYSHWNKRLEVGLGRRGEQHAILNVGDRCTFHDNKIDLACDVVIGNDVGLSPEVTIYTHHYWQSPLNGYPMKYSPVSIGAGSIIGYRSTILAGSRIPNNSVVPAGTVVRGDFKSLIKCPREYGPLTKEHLLRDTVTTYIRSCEWRGITPTGSVTVTYPIVHIWGMFFNCELLEITGGVESEYTDDFRDFMFKRGIRFFTNRPFKKLDNYQKVNT